MTEKPHSNAEREALAQMIADAEAHPHFKRPPSVQPLAGDYRAADAILAAGFRRQGPPTDDEREALAQAIDPNALELDAYPFPLDAADRVIAAGFRRQGPITDAQVRAALSAWYSGSIAGGWTERHEVAMRAALEAAERARSAVPSTTEQEKP